MPRVLIVDDQPETAESLAELVKLWGHQASIAATALGAGGHRAFAAGRRRPRHRPAGDGRVRGRAATPREAGGDQLVLVALTGHGTDEHLREAEAAGFDHHVLKPIDFERLEALLVHPARRPRL